jgi:3-oxosteroid 1-dehydrogenase
MSNENRENTATRELGGELPPRGTRVDRRRFLATAGAAGVGLAAGEGLAGPGMWLAHAAEAVDSNPPAIWDMTADVVVVGTGGAGFAAAVTARSKGSSVIMLEKGLIYGGTTAKSGGTLWIPNNSIMRAQGIADPKEWALRYMVRLSYPAIYDPTHPQLGLPAHEFSLIETFYDKSSEAIDYLGHIGALIMVADLGVGGPAKLQVDYHADLPEDKAPRGRHLNPSTKSGGFGAGLIIQMKSWADAHKIPILLQHAVTKAYRNSAGQVIGVGVNAQGKTLAIRARKAVVFGSGGFTANREMAQNFLRGPIFGGCGVPTNTGDLVPIAAGLGADLGNMNNAWWLQIPLEIVVNTAGSSADVWLPYGDSMIQVNKYGRRVVNEKVVYNERSQVHHIWDPFKTEYPNLVMFMIWDDGVAKNPTNWPFRFPVPLPGQTSPYVIAGKTLADLAHNVDARLASLAHQTGGLRLAPDFAAQLAQTIQRFNALASTGKDLDFHRGEAPIEIEWNGPARKGNTKNPTMYPFSTAGPYYCVPLAGATLDTKGGPKINARAQIIDAQGRPIPGLYGAGNCIASPASQAYWSAGGTLGPAVTYGYLAGLHATAEPVKDV